MIIFWEINKIPSARLIAFIGNLIAGGMPMQETQETQVRSLSLKDPLEKGMTTPPVFLPGGPLDRGAWRATVHGVAESDTPEPIGHIC